MQSKQSKFVALGLMLLTALVFVPTGADGYYESFGSRFDAFEHTKLRIVDCLERGHRILNNEVYEDRYDTKTFQFKYSDGVTNTIRYSYGDSDPIELMGGDNLGSTDDGKMKIRYEYKINGVHGIDFYLYDPVHLGQYPGGSGGSTCWFLTLRTINDAFHLFC